MREEEKKRDRKVRACLYSFCFLSTEIGCRRGTFQFSKRFGEETHVKEGRESRMMEKARGIETSGAITGRSI